MSTPALSIHKCSVPGCNVSIAINMLMCRRHWCLVPYPTRAKVARGKEDYLDGRISLFELKGIEARATACVSGTVAKGGAQ